MTPNEHDERAPADNLQTEAARWFVRIHTREPSTEEVASWQRWLMADSTHREAFSRYETLWGTIQQTRDLLGAPDNDTAASVIRESRRRWPHAMAASVALALVGLGWVAMHSLQSAPLAASAVVETRLAEDRTYALADGSRIEVGASTRVVVDFNEQNRTVIIDEGEAYFEVAHETRPFIVRAGSGTITAVGTAFNVHNVAGRVAVAVVEGAVNVAKAAPRIAAPMAPARVNLAVPESQIVRAGEGVIYDRELETVEPIDTHVAIAWREGRLTYIREPLGYVVADVKRYSEFRITIADPAVAELRYTGTVVAADIDDWLELLPQVFPVDVVRVGKRAALLKLRTEASAP